MERNFKSDQVVMAVEFYEKLMAIAYNELSCAEYNKIDRHVRKFNRPRRDKHITELHFKMLDKYVAIRVAKEFFSKNAGKMGSVLGRPVKVCEVYKRDKSRIVVEYKSLTDVKTKVPVDPEKIIILDSTE